MRLGFKKWAWALPAAATFAAFLVGSLTLATRTLKVKDRVLLADAAQPAFGLVYIALAQGFFEDEDLEIELREFSSGRDALRAVLNRQADLATSFETPVVMQMLQGKDLAVITSLHEGRRNTGLIVKTGPEIHGIKSLRGKKVGVTLGTTSEFLGLALLDQSGMARSEVTLVNLEPEAMLAALENGSIQAAATWNPHLSRFREALGAEQCRVLFSNAYFETSMLTGLRSEVLSRPDVYTRLLRALYRAETFEDNHPKQAESIVVEHLSPKHGPRDEIATLSGLVERRLKLNNVSLAIMRQQAELFESLESERPAPVNIAKALYPTLLEAVSSEAVTLANFRAVDSK